MIGDMTFLEYLPKVNGSTRGRFKCFCGNEFEARIGDVRRDNNGCGCRKRGEGHPQYKHGHSHRIHATITYNSWKGAVNRCTRPSHNKYEFYGGAGIKICERWLTSFENFLADMGERPSPNHSLDRYPNNKGNYEPGNCRWATRKEQIENRECTIYLTLNGQKMTLVDWAAITGIKKKTLSARYYFGWSHERILTTPTQN